MHKKLTKNRFKKLGKALADNDIDINYMIDWANDNGLNTGQPRLGNGNYNGIEGWYFTKPNKNDYTNKQIKVIKETLLSKGFKCKGVSEGEMDIDDDRYFYPTIKFILND